MLTKVELFDALRDISPRTRLAYEIILNGSIVVWIGLSAAIIAGLSVLLASVLVQSDLSTESLIGAIILPAVMAFLVVAASVRSPADPHQTWSRTMRAAGWRGAWAGFVVGLIVVSLSHFLGQLLLTRAIYGALHFQKHILSYCGPIPVLYGVLFALPVAVGTGLFSAMVSISAQLAYNAIRAVQKR